MDKTKVVVDTCLLELLTEKGEHVDFFKKVMREFNYQPVVHPYIFEHEFQSAYMRALVTEGCIDVVKYEDFIGDEKDKLYYESLFEMLYKEIMYWQEKNSPWKVPNVRPDSFGDNIYEQHFQGSSMGDVHMVLMAWFLQLPIILSDDKEVGILKSIASRRFSLASSSLTVLSSLDLLKNIASDENSLFKWKEIKSVVNRINVPNALSEIRRIWNSKNQ